MAWSLTQTQGTAVSSAAIVAALGIDGSGPTISDPSPTDGSWIPHGKQTASTAVGDATGVIDIKLVVGGAEKPTTIEDARHVATWTAPAQGPIDITWRATDYVGNTSELTVTLNVDAAPPDVGKPSVPTAILSGGTLYAATGVVKVRASVTDLGSGVDSVTIGGQPMEREWDPHRTLAGVRIRSREYTGVSVANCRRALGGVGNGRDRR
ncbi:MAG: hypothetical protein ACI9OJ_002104 [Myxococcota bacterium]|jgi:hypothetical protein